MSHTKSRSPGMGITGLLTNLGVYQRWALTTPARAQYANVTFQLAGMKDGSDISQKENRLTEKL